MRCAFWKEEPSLRDALFLFDPAEIDDVYVVPNFISEGYFTQTVIPRELELEGGTTRRSNGSRQVTYNKHPLYTYTLDKKAGQTKGEGILAFGAKWYAVSAKGTAVVKRSTTTTTTMTTTGCPYPPC